MTLSSPSIIPRCAIARSIRHSLRNYYTATTCSNYVAKLQLHKHSCSFYTLPLSRNVRRSMTTASTTTVASTTSIKEQIEQVVSNQDLEEQREEQQQASDEVKADAQFLHDFLSALLNQYGSNKAKTHIDRSTLDMIMKKVLQAKSNDTILNRGVKILSIVAENPSNIRMLLDTGCIDIICNALRFYKRLNMTLNTLALLSRLLFSRPRHPCWLNFIKEGGFEKMMIFYNKVESEKALKWMFTILAQLADTSPTIIKQTSSKFKLARGSQLISRSIVNFASDAQVQFDAMKILYVFELTELPAYFNLQKHIKDSSSIRALLQIVNYPYDEVDKSRVYRAGMVLSLLAKDVNTRVSMIERNITARIFKAMLVHQADPDALIPLLFTLASMLSTSFKDSSASSEAPAVRTVFSELTGNQIVEVEGIKVLLNLLFQYSDHQPVRESVIFLMYHLSNFETAKIEIIKFGGPGLIVQSLRRFPDDTRTIQEVIEIFNNLCEGNHARNLSILNQYGYFEAIKSTLEAFPGNTRLGSAIIHLLKIQFDQNYGEGLDQILGKLEFKTILKFFSLNPTSKEVQWIALDTIMHVIHTSMHSLDGVERECVAVVENSRQLLHADPRALDSASRILFAINQKVHSGDQPQPNTPSINQLFRVDMETLRTSGFRKVWIPPNRVD